MREILSRLPMLTSAVLALGGLAGVFTGAIAWTAQPDDREIALTTAFIGAGFLSAGLVLAMNLGDRSFAVRTGILCPECGRAREAAIDFCTFCGTTRHAKVGKAAATTASQGPRATK